MLLAVSAAFTAIGAAMIRDTSAGFAGWYCAIFFGLCTLIALTQTVLGGRLTLSPAGMRLVHLGRSHSWAWPDVSGFRVWRGFNNAFVTFDNAKTKSGMLKQINKAMGAGVNALPPSWAMSADALVDLLEDCKRRWG